MSALSYSTFLLRCSGMWYFDDWLTGWKKKFYIFYTILIFIVVYIFSLSHTIILYDYMSDVNKLASVSFTTIGFVTSCIKMFIMIFKRKNIGELMKTLDTELFNPQDQNEMIIYSESFCNLKFANTSRILFAGSLLFQCCGSALVLSLIVYTLSQKNLMSAGFFLDIMYLGAFLFEFFMYCQFADEVLVESGNLGTSIYVSDWQFLSVNTQKSLMIVMARTLKPFEYKLSHVVLSLESFTAMIKISFSTFNILQKTPQ